VSGGFTVVLGDLRSMGSTFLSEHGEYLKVKDRITPAAAATGDGNLDETLCAVMDAVAMMHEVLAARILEHADKLGKAADSYERSDIDSHGVFDDLMAG
jgi:hypothetical protein